MTLKQLKKLIPRDVKLLNWYPRKRDADLCTVEIIDYAYLQENLRVFNLVQEGEGRLRHYLSLDPFDRAYVQIMKRLGKC